jgi:hypothetical protein
VPTNGWEGMWGSTIEFEDAEEMIPLLQVTLAL